MSFAPNPPAAPRRVLEDASGRRLRFLRRLGRAVALLLVLWLCAVFLGGLGVGPATHVPFGQLLRPTLAPPKLQQAPRVSPPAPADLVPAVPASAAPALLTTTQLTATTTTTTKGKSASAPGHAATTTSHGKSAAAPGHTKTTTTTRTNTHSNRPVAPPGQTKTTTNRGKKR
jgi:hypothetical protein